MDSLFELPSEPPKASLATPEQRRKRSLEKAREGASPAWMDAAKRLIWRYARMRIEFTSDDIWREIELDHPNLSTPESGAMTVALRDASRAGFITQTGLYRKSEWREGGARPVVIWIGTAKAAATGK